MSMLTSTWAWRPPLGSVNQMSTFNANPLDQSIKLAYRAVPTDVCELAIRLAPLARAGAGDVQVASLALRGVVSEEIEAAGIAVSSLDAKGPRDARVVARLHRLITRGRIDTVFSFLVHANAAAAAVSLFARNIRFIQSIQTTQPEPRWHWRVQRIAQRAAEKIVVPSPSVA